MSMTATYYRFCLRSLRLSDRDALGAIAQYTYGGHDYIVARLPFWMQYSALYRTLAIEYLGPIILSPSADQQHTQQPKPNMSQTTQGNSSNIHSEEKDAHGNIILTLSPKTTNVKTDKADPISPSASSSSSSSSSSSGSIDELTPSLSSFISHVIGLEVLSILDDGQTGWLQALRVHPTFRGFGLSSILHQYIIQTVAHSISTIQQLRETTITKNQISLYLSSKFNFQQVHFSDYTYMNRQAISSVLETINAQIAYLSKKQQKEANSIQLVQGTISQVLQLWKEHPNDLDLTLLRQDWVVWSGTERNLRLLTGESFKASMVSASSSSSSSSSSTAANITYSADMLSNPSLVPESIVSQTITPHYLTITYDIDHPSQILSFCLSSVDEEYKGWYRSYSVYATPSNYLACLVHVKYELEATRANKHETWQLFKAQRKLLNQLLHSEAEGTEAASNSTSSSSTSPDVITTTTSSSSPHATVSTADFHASNPLIYESPEFHGVVEMMNGSLPLWFFDQYSKINQEMKEQKESIQSHIEPEHLEAPPKDKEYEHGWQPESRMVLLERK